MDAGKSKRLAASATPWDDMPEDELDPSQAIVAASHKGIYAFRHERYAGDADFFNGYPLDCCPHCSGPIAKAGLNRAGVQRYRCKACKKISTPVTGTIFDNAKLPVTAWADFILQAVSFESISSMTREDRRADTTSSYWMAKLFAVLDGIQNNAMLAGRVWIDEKYYPVAAKDAFHRPDGKLLRGLSRNQICIGVGTDEHGRTVFVTEGCGITTAAKTMAAFGDKIARGSTLVHDMESSHNRLVRELGLVNEVYNGNLLKGIPDKRNPLQPVNRACYFVQRFLNAHSGFDRDDIQNYLNLLYVALNEPDNKLDKVAKVLDRSMRCSKTLRFRDFYNIKPSSEDCGE